MRILRWSRDRVAEGAPLLREYVGKTCIEGSNPSDSASTRIASDRIGSQMSPVCLVQRGFLLAGWLPTGADPSCPCGGSPWGAAAGLGVRRLATRGMHRCSCARGQRAGAGAVCGSPKPAVQDALSLSARVWPRLAASASDSLKAASAVPVDKSSTEPISTPPAGTVRAGVEPGRDQRSGVRDAQGHAGVRAHARAPAGGPGFA